MSMEQEMTKKIKYTKESRTLQDVDKTIPACRDRLCEAWAFFHFEVQVHGGCASIHLWLNKHPKF